MPCFDEKVHLSVFIFDLCKECVHAALWTLFLSRNSNKMIMILMFDSTTLLHNLKCGIKFHSWAALQTTEGNWSTNIYLNPACLRTSCGSRTVLQAVYIRFWTEASFSFVIHRLWIIQRLHARHYSSLSKLLVMDLFLSQIFMFWS